MMELKTFSSVSVFRQKGNAAAVAGGWLALFALENQQSIGAAFLAVIVIFGIFGVLVVGVERVRVVDYLVAIGLSACARISKLNTMLIHAPAHPNSLMTLSRLVESLTVAIRCIS